MSFLTDTNSSLSRELLDHDGLMTPVLIRQFGPMNVRQTYAQHNEDRFLRHSTIYQSASGEKILEAVLDISLRAVPIGFLDLLQSKDVLFGQLLMDLSIAVRIVDRNVYRSETDHPPRWGRRLAIQHCDSQVVICKVDELLVSEPHLLRLAL